MSNNINSNTDFNNLTINNDYPCLNGGTWTAKLVNGETVYTNGTTTYTGPVNLIGGTLTVESGAVVDGLTSLSSAIITVNTGGTIENSDLIGGLIYNSGTSQNNNYVKEDTYMYSGSNSNNDSFYRPITTSVYGSLNLTQLPNTTTYYTGAYTGLLSTGVANVHVNDPHYYNNNSPTGVYTTIIMGGSAFGDPATGVGYDPSIYNNSFTLSNDYPTYVGGTWYTKLVNGQTIYHGDGVTGGVATGTVEVTGPINLVSTGSLTINPGTVVNGITMTGSATPYIYNSGTLQNSFIANGYLQNLSGGLSQNNTLISEVYQGFSGGTSKNDYFYEAGTTYYGNYNLTNTNGTSLSTFILTDGTAQQYIYAGSTYDGTYSVAGSAGSIPIEMSYAADVSCFLAGSMINTPNGLVAVEDIKVGDVVISYNGNQQENRAVIWTGYNTVVVNASLPEDEANYPVRVLKDAIADNVPSKDLLVTQEHCILIDNQFIPVRMLVNNSTIFYDHSITEYTYYHIETELHSVIMADGVLTESYLDTGNRSSFKSDGNIVSIVNKNKQWNLDSAAPLVTERNIVELIFYKLLTRAHMLGLPYNLPNLPTTTDYGLYLLTDHNEIIEIAYHNQNRFAFKIPENVTNVRLMSHTSQPSKIIGAFVDDRRHLGVLVGDITLLEHKETYSIDTHLKSSILSGWDGQETTSCRWTNGNALLPIRKEESQYTAMLIIHVIDGGPYFVQAEEEKLQVNVN